ncbi:hypothetical protein [Bdellovibrio svalbardensis]|uniref:Uncharacterized protein n=1 Tax=Bdellovibrio svalbardensis TaxID=2972972 RepID=A0ABT6DGQ2_9BACT|nr:hypothetical protein [Bdellovibrio svalbardensis]MDG0816006.1 hypothetical protein [Bdellovibrio svalbardensis]
MKFYVCSLLTTAALALPAHAATPVDETQDDQGKMVVSMVEQNLFNPLAMPASCTAVMLDDTQKASMKQAYFEFAKQKNTLSAEVKNAWLDVRHTFMSKDSTKDEGTAALTAAKTAMNNLGDAMGMLSIKIFYDILKPEQREPAWKCMMDLKKMKNEEMLRAMCAKLPPATPTPTPTP